MNADATQYTESTIPQDAISRMDFALRCVHTRLSYPHIPISAMSVLLTLTGLLSTEILEYVTEADHEDITDEESIAALAIIAGALGLASHVLGELARKISPSAVKSIRSTYCIIGIVPTSIYYTTNGLGIPT